MSPRAQAVLGERKAFLIGNGVTFDMAFPRRFSIEPSASSYAMAMALNYASSIGKNGQKAIKVFITCFFDGLTHLDIQHKPEVKHHQMQPFGLSAPLAMFPIDSAA